MATVTLKDSELPVNLREAYNENHPPPEEGEAVRFVIERSETVAD